MPYNYDHIEDTNLWLGQKIDTPELCQSLKNVGITHVINLWSGNPEPYWDGSVLTLKQEDDGTPRPSDQIRQAIKYAQACTGQLYIHCQWGLGRAPSTTYAILRSRGYNSQQSQDLIIHARPKCYGCWEHYIPSIEASISY